MAEMDPEVAAAAAVAVAGDAATLRQPFAMHERCVIKKLLLAGSSMVGQTVVVGGWVRTGRLAKAGELAFLEMSDGSSHKTLQCVVENQPNLKGLTATGACVMMRGEIKQHPEQVDVVEIHAKEILHFGESPSESYPIPKGKQGVKLETLRELIHMRIRTNTIAAVTRVRNSLGAATHRFFQDNGFVYVNTPLITASDCEGAGEMFQITTLLSEAEKAYKQPLPTLEEIAAAELAVASSEGRLAELNAKEGKKDKRKIKVSSAPLAAILAYFR